MSGIAGTLGLARDGSRLSVRASSTRTPYRQLDNYSAAHAGDCCEPATIPVGPFATGTITRDVIDI